MNPHSSATVTTHPAMRLPIRLGTRHRRALYASFALLWFSGMLWLLFHYFLRNAGPFGDEPHRLEAWWLRLHGLAMMIMLLAAGTVVVHHAHRAWQLHRHRLVGTLLTGSLLWLALSGYALYYFSSDDNRDWLPLLHWLPGIALPLVVALHARGGSRRRPLRATTQTSPHAPAMPSRALR